MAAKLYLLPKLHVLRPQTVLLPILLRHAFRHLGLMFLAEERGNTNFKSVSWQEVAH